MPSTLSGDPARRARTRRSSARPPAGTRRRRSCGRVDRVSKNDTVDRTRGPELELSTSIGKDDSALVIGLISASSPDDAENADPTAEPTLAIGDGILDDAQAAAITAALTALGATGSHGEVTRTAAPESLPDSSSLYAPIMAKSPLIDTEQPKR